jgi:hypothetical protein
MTNDRSAKCDQFEREIYWLIYAGFAQQNPFFVLSDWHKQPREMNASDILEYVDHHFGEPYLTFCRGITELRIH